MGTTDDTNFILVAIGYILAVVTGLAFVVDVLMLKGSQYILENYVTAFYWYYLISTILSAVAMMIFEHAVLPETLYEVFLIAGHSFGYVFNLPIYNFTAKYVSGNTVTIIYSTTVVFMLIPQYTVLSSIHPGHRNWIEVLGVGFVLIGSISKSLLELFSGRGKD